MLRHRTARLDLPQYGGNLLLGKLGLLHGPSFLAEGLQAG